MWRIDLAVQCGLKLLIPVVVLVDADGMRVMHGAKVNSEAL